MKNLFRMGVCLLFVVILSKGMYADGDNIVRAYLSDASGRIIPAPTILDWTKDPSVYLFAKFNYFNATVTETFTNARTGKSYTYTQKDQLPGDLLLGEGGKKDILDLAFNWNDIAQNDRNGQWTWIAKGDHGIGTRNGNFKVEVVPEPVSSVLFLIGGAGLAARQYKKRKKDFV